MRGWLFYDYVDRIAGFASHKRPFVKGVRYILFMPFLINPIVMYYKGLGTKDVLNINALPFTISHLPTQAF